MPPSYRYSYLKTRHVPVTSHVNKIGLSVLQGKFIKIYMKFAADILLSLAPIILEADPREIADLSSTREIRREVYRAFPEPEQLAAVDAGELASVVRNERKVEYLQAVIRFFNEVDEQFLRYGDYDEVVAKIRGIRGVGEWSSYFIMVRGLGRMERVSTVDQELAKAAAAV